MYNYREARVITSTARFNLHSWSSNSAELNTTATQNNVADNSKLVNILGLTWNQTTDELTVAGKPSTLSHNHLVTNRQLLQELTKVFETLEFIAPVVIPAKLLIQQLWNSMG